MENYVKSVLPGETSPGYDPYEFLKAQAIAARMYAHHQTSAGAVVINNSIEKQLYIPNAEHPRSNQAVADTDGIVVTYQGEIINAFFSADHGKFSPGPDYTRDGGTPYLKSVYDPVVGGGPDAAGHGWGMAQTGAKNWAKGQDNQGSSVPPWDYCRILSHYYTGVEFECRNTASPTLPDHRFDLLYLNGWDNREANPVPWPVNGQQNVQFILQNTGNNTWTLSDCSQSYDQRTIALAGHWYEYHSTQPYGPIAEFDYGRMRLCQYPDDDLNWRTRIEPGETYPIQEPDHAASYAYGDFYIPGADKLNVGQLYWLRWDVEFRPPHDITWGSRLDAQSNPDNQRWPTQDLLVRITSGTSNPPEDPDLDLDPPHQVDAWSNEAEVNISWQSGGGSVDHYDYAWEQGGQVESWQTTNSTSLNVTRSEGTHAFHLQAVAGDGQASDVVSLDPILIDLTPPTAAVTPLPAVITNPTEISFTLSWSGNDEGGSGLFFDVAYMVNPPDGEPHPVQIVMTTATHLNLSDLGLTLQEGTQYTFWVRGRDGAENVSAAGDNVSAAGDNVSNWPVTQTVYRPVPMFRLKPAQISRFRIYTDTTPLVETMTIENIGGGELDWTATVPYTQTTLSQNSGIATSTFLITVTYPMTFGVYSYPITFSGPISTYNNPQVLPITIRVVAEIFSTYLPLIFK